MKAAPYSPNALLLPFVSFCVQLLPAFISLRSVAENTPDIIWMQPGDSSYIADIKVSPDGNLLATAEEAGGSIKVWHLSTGKLIRTFNGISDRFSRGKGIYGSRIAFSPDDQSLAFVNQKRETELRRISDGSLLKNFGARGFSGYNPVAFSPDGRTLAIGICCDAGFEYWRLADFKLLGTARGGVISPDLRFSYDFGHVWGAFDGVTMADPDAEPKLGSLDNVFAFARNSQAVLRSPIGIPPQQLIGWSQGQQQILATYSGSFRPEAGWVGAIFSPDGQLMINSINQLQSDNSIDHSKPSIVQIFETYTGKLLQTVAFPYSAYGVLTAVEIAPDNLTLFCGFQIPGDYGGDGGRLWQYRLSDGGKEPLSVNAGPIQALTFSPDGKMVASASGGSGGGTGTFSVLLSATSDGTVIRTLAGLADDVSSRTAMGCSVSFSPDGTLIAAANRSGGLIRVWTVSSGILAGTPAWMKGAGVAFSPDGKTLAITSREGFSTRVSMFRVADWNEIYSTPPQEGSYGSISFSPNGEFLLLGPYDGGSGEIRPSLIRASDGTIVRTFSEIGQWVGAVFSPDQKVVAVEDGRNATINIRQLSDGSLMRTLANPPGSYLTAMAFAPDGKTLSMAWSGGTLHVCRVSDGAVVRSFTQETGSQEWYSQISSIAYSPDSRLLAYGRRDGIVVAAHNPALTPPVITAQPSNQTIIGGETVTFRVTASGDGVLTYQWQKAVSLEGPFVDIQDATSSTLTLNNVPLSDNGARFKVRVTNAGGFALSDAAVLTVNPGISPQVVSGPVSLNAALNGAASFRVLVSGTTPITYQWQLDGKDLAGATASTLALDNLSPPNSGKYTVVIRNAWGSVTSAPATLTLFGDLKMYAGITLAGPVGTRFEIEFTEDVSDPVEWVHLGAVDLPASPYVFIDFDSPGKKHRYYRGVVKP